MASDKEYPVNFTARGLADAWDATEAFPGACRSLQNLVFDQSNPDLMTCRPGIGSPLTTFSGFTSPTTVTCLEIVGDVVYGMVSTSRLGSYDEPFAYNILSNTFTSITGTSTNNLPVTQSIIGDWNPGPPTIAMVGASLLFTHPGFSGVSQTGTCTASVAAGSSLLVVTDGGTASTNSALHVGANITGTGITGLVSIVGFVQGSGTEGGAGTYILSQTIAAGFGSETVTCTSSNYFGVLDLSVPSAPVWYSTNTGVYQLRSVPNSVVNFNNRAYFACGNNVLFSDVLQPTNMTSAGQSLTVGDTTNIIAMQGLPIQTATSGVVGALMVFKDFQIWQITGDAAITNSLSQNFLSLNIGCIAPNTIVQTPAGMFFISIDGPYYITSLGQVLPLTKDPSKLVQDVQKPFQNIINPTRANAQFSGSIYRVSLYTSQNTSSVQVDYWFDVTVRRWNGPHTLGYDNISSYKNYFIIANTPYGAALFASQYIPLPTSVYNDNGSQLVINLQSSFLPKTQNINVKQVITSTAEFSSSTALVQYNLIAVGENFQTLGNCSINAINPAYLWGTTAEGGSNLTWGTVAEGGSGSVWESIAGNPITYTLPWPAPIVFKKLSIEITASSSYSIEIGAIFFKYIDCGYPNI